MALVLYSISIQGFRSFMDEETLEIPRDIGVFLITGKNAAGKTSFLEALCWTFYGKTSEGLKASQIGNWAGEHLTNVSVEYEIGGRISSLVRRWNPNALVLQKGLDEPETVEQHELDNQLGCNYELFLASTMFSQFGKGFMDLDRGDQAKALTRVLGLDEWDGRTAAAKKSLSSYKDAAEKHERTTAACKARRSAMIEQWDELLNRAEQWDDAQARRKKKQKSEIDSREKSLLVVRGKLKQIKIDIGAAGNRLRELQLEVVEKDKAVSDFRKSTHDCELQLRLKLSQHRELSDPSEVCSQCNQEIPRTVLQGMAVKCKRVQREVEHFRRSYISAQEKMVAEKLVLDRVSSEVSKCRESVQDHEYEKRDVISKIDVLQIQLRTLREQFAEKNPHNSLIDDLDVKIQRAEKDLATCKVTRTRHERFIAQATFGVQVFPKIKLWVLECALLELTTFINNALPQLGLNGWESECSASRTLASGELRAAFDLRIRAPGSSESVTWKAWCGGERQRLKIAGSAAFADLVVAKNPRAPNFEFWDEPTKNLDEQGCNDLMEFFRYRSRSRKRQVWIIDHRVQYSGQFVKHWHFVKDERGTHVC